MTEPAGTALFCCGVVPVVHPAAVRAALAAACVLPTTFGTSAPSDTTIDTLLPGVTLVPAPGAWLTTVPMTTLVLFAREMAAGSPTAPIALVAPASGWPVTFGTETRGADAFTSTCTIPVARRPEPSDTSYVKTSFPTNETGGV